MATTEAVVTHITFDFDSYDFWNSWEQEDLDAIDTTTSMCTYFITAAKQIAESYGATWKASWSETGSGHKVYVDFEDENASGAYRIEEQILDEAAHPGLEQEEWIVE